MNIISGLFNESDIRVGIIASRFNEVIVSKLIDGAADGLARHCLLYTSDAADESVPG